MAVEEKGGVVFSAGHVLMPSKCIRLDDGNLSLKGGVQPKELYTSAEELVPKVRKPYTITKQRERWTEEEHKKFIEALKLHGRAWRRIEEHIGTKTAVQIRSHAQKFFSKVVRESSSNSSSTKSIDIPPPRPKRKPMHPYPRKLTHPSIKGSSASGRTENPVLPSQSVPEKEKRSPSPVISVIGSDSMGSTISNPTNGCSSPNSSATGPNPTSFFLGEQGNGSPSTPSTVEKDRSPSPVLGSTSIQQDKPSMDLETFFKDYEGNKEVSSLEVPTVSLKLFGRTVLVTDSHRPLSPSIGSIPHQSKPLVINDADNQQQSVEANGHKEEEQTPPCYFSGDQCQSGWNPWPRGVPPVYYCMPIKEEDSNAGEVSISTPLWAWSGSFSFPPVNCQNNQKPLDSCKNATDDKDSNNKEGSSSDSNLGSVSEVGLGDGNSDSGESQNVEKVREPIAVVCLKASENLAFSSGGFCSNNDLEKKPPTTFRLKASENSAFTVRAAISWDNGKGFVPYKRCIAKRDVQQTQIGNNEREAQRIRLCL